jgi:hypothetical protein
MNMHAAVFGGRGVVAEVVVVMIEGFVVVLAVGFIMIIMACIQSDGMDGVASSVVMIVRMRRGSRNEAIACKGKRQAKAHEAPGK